MQVKEEHPLLINQFTAIARKQGFPDVIMPGKETTNVVLIQDMNYQQYPQPQYLTTLLIFTVHTQLT